MDKQEYLVYLRKKLAGLPKEEIEERVAFYREMIDDRMEEGLSESEAVLAVCSVDDLSASAAESTPPPVFSRLRPWEILLIILGLPIWLSLIISVAAVVLSLYVSLWAVIVSFWAVFASVVGCCVAGLLAGIVFICTGIPLPGIAMLSIGILCAGLSILLLLCCKAATTGTALLTKKLVMVLKRRKKEVV